MSQPSSDPSDSPAICFDRRQLRQYLDGEVPEQSSAMIEKHVGDCPGCERLLSELERESHPLAKPPAAEAPKRAESIIEQAIQNSKRILSDNTMKPDFPSTIPTNLSDDLGPYQLLRPLGRGGMGMVYLAKHRKLNRNVAVKLLPSTFVSDDVKARFEREILAAGRLRHPSIVSATDAGQAAGMQYLVMELVDGLDLGQIARNVPSISIADVCEIGRQMALGLSFAHAAGMVHRDIKPSNVMLDTSGSIKLLDFGLVLLDRWDGAVGELTTIGQFLGTLDYMAPEQAERCGSVDYRADLYSLGATLFRLLCGRAPLAAAPNQSPLEKLRLLATHRPPSLKTLRPDAPETLIELVDSLLASKPEDRPASAAHVAEQLQTLSAESNLPALLASAKTTAASSEASERQNLFHSLPELPPNTKQSLPPKSPLLRRFALTAAIPLILFAGYMIALETRKGQLVIVSEVADIKVKLLRDGKPVKDLTIQTGSTATRLAADRYEIELDTSSDALQIENDKFTLKNGETIVATIRQTQSLSSHPSPLLTGEGPGVRTESPASPTHVPSSSHRVYDGKIFDEWLSLLRTDRSPSTIYNAFEGAVALVPRERQSELDAVLVDLFENLPEQKYVTYLLKHPEQNLVPLLAAFDRSRNNDLSLIGSAFDNCFENDGPIWDPLWRWLEGRLESADSTIKITDRRLWNEIIAFNRNARPDQFALYYFDAESAGIEKDQQRKLAKRLIRLFKYSPSVAVELFAPFTKLQGMDWSEQDRKTLDACATSFLSNMKQNSQNNLYASLCWLVGEDFSKSKVDSSIRTAILDRFLVSYAKQDWFEAEPLPLSDESNASKPPQIAGLNIEFQRDTRSSGGGMGGGGMGGMGGGERLGHAGEGLVFQLLAQIERLEMKDRPIEGLKAVAEASLDPHDDFQKLLIEQNTPKESDDPFGGEPIQRPIQRPILGWPNLLINTKSRQFMEGSSSNVRIWSYIVHRWAKQLLGAPLPDVLTEMSVASTPTAAAKTPPKPAAADEPVYEGKTFHEWLSMMRTERAERECARIAIALEALDTPAHALELDSAVLDVLSQRPNMAMQYILLPLNRPEKNLGAIVSYLTEHPPNRALVRLLLSHAYGNDGPAYDPFWVWLNEQLDQQNDSLTSDLLVEHFDGYLFAVQAEAFPEQIDQASARELLRRKTHSLALRFLKLMDSHARVKSRLFPRFAEVVKASSPKDVRDEAIRRAVEGIDSESESAENYLASFDLLSRLAAIQSVDAAKLSLRLDQALSSFVSRGLSWWRPYSEMYVKFPFDEVKLDCDCVFVKNDVQPETPGILNSNHQSGPFLPVLLLHIGRLPLEHRPLKGLRLIANATTDDHQGFCIESRFQNFGDSNTKLAIDLRSQKFGYQNPGASPELSRESQNLLAFIVHRWANHLLGTPLDNSSDETASPEAPNLSEPLQK